MKDLPIQPGHIVAGRYRVDGVLGTGAMSVVVGGTHVEIGRRVAIKFLNPQLHDAHAAERFRREAQRAAKIRNEHVVRVIDVGTLESGLPFMVMDLVEGRSLEDELRAQGPLPVQLVVDYVLQAIEGLSEAHALGIVHRDVKPANLFLARRCDGSQLVKIMDFGVSKSLVESNGDARLGLTRTGMLIGSPLYMAPEQLQSAGSVDERADIWGLGVVLFELVTGRVPYETSSLPELCSLLLGGQPADVTDHRPDVPDAFAAVIARCLRRERSERYGNLAELADALVEFGSPGCSVHAACARRLLAGSSAPAPVLQPVSTPEPVPCSTQSGPPRRRAALLASSLVLAAFGGLGFAIASGQPSAHLQASGSPQTAVFRDARPTGTHEPTPLPDIAPSVQAPSRAETEAQGPLRRHSPPVLVPPRVRLLATAAPATSLASAAPPYRLPDFGGRQ